jgi:hypothetical protein
MNLNGIGGERADWIHLAQDSVEWKVLVKTTIIICVQQKEQNSSLAKRLLHSQQASYSMKSISELSELSNEV